MMCEQKTDVAVQADSFSWQYLGNLPGCVALGCADIGEATIDGEHVFVTWGRNLDAEKQIWFSQNTKFRPIRLGADDGSAELILPSDIAEKLLSLIAV